MGGLSEFNQNKTQQQTFKSYSAPPTEQLSTYFHKFYLMHL